MSLLRCGPSGWNFRHWEGTVYPLRRPRTFHPVEFLADRFDLVEIDQTFRQFVRPELTRLWASKVAHNRDFQFTARLHRQFTHERNLDPGDIRRFCASLEPLAEEQRLGCLLMQFPSSFRFTAENKTLLIALRRAFHQFPLVAELRHRTWGIDEALGTLIDYHIGFCNLDQPENIRAMPPTAHLTWKVGYVKMHGRIPGGKHDEFFGDDNRDEAGKDYLYTLADLHAWKQRVEKVARFSERTFVVFANHGAGKSVINAMQMQGLFQSSPAAPGLSAAPPNAQTAQPARQADSLLAVA